MTLITDLRRDFEDNKAMVNTRRQALVERIDQEDADHRAMTAALEAGHGLLDRRLEGLAVGDLLTALIGLFLTLVGTIESALAPDLARLFGS